MIFFDQKRGRYLKTKLMAIKLILWMEGVVFFTYLFLFK